MKYNRKNFVWKPARRFVSNTADASKSTYIIDIKHIKYFSHKRMVYKEELQI